MNARMMPDHRLVSATEMSAVIACIMVRRQAQAWKSEYDVMVCVRSVEAAKEVFEAIPVEGTAMAYGRAVEAALNTLENGYCDNNGEYTSKGLIGDIGLDIFSLLEAQETAGLTEIDRREAEECLMAEMIALVPSAPDLEKDAEVTIKTETVGKSGFKYFVEMTFELAPQDRVALVGHIYTNESYQFPILDERLERTSLETE